MSHFSQIYCLIILIIVVIVVIIDVIVVIIDIVIVLCHCRHHHCNFHSISSDIVILLNYVTKVKILILFNVIIRSWSGMHIVIVFHRSGKHILTACQDRSIRVYSVAGDDDDYDDDDHNS